ncbi:MAG: response regulator [Ktedonobacteraceae bacterium]|nr:response regulator [Ktedonobacteraceae bacterium]
MLAPRILIIDDSITICALVKRILQQEGYQVITANDGREGLSMALREMPHCVILDVVLPGMSGFEVCRNLRTRSAQRNIPIIMVSTKNTPVDKSWALRQGATRYLVKPFSNEELLALVREELMHFIALSSDQQATSPPGTPGALPVTRRPASPPGQSRDHAVPVQFPFPSHSSSTDLPLQAGASPAQKNAGEQNRLPLLRLVPQRLSESADPFWRRSPHVLFSIDRQTRLLYEAIDGHRDIAMLCALTHMSLQEVTSKLRHLLLQHRIQIREPGGRIVSSTTFIAASR